MWSRRGTTFACGVVIVIALGCRAWYEVPFTGSDDVGGLLLVQTGFRSFERIEMRTGERTSFILPPGIEEVNYLVSQAQLVGIIRASGVTRLFSLSGEPVGSAPWDLYRSGVYQLSIDPGGARAAYFDQEGGLVLRDLPSGRADRTGLRGWLGGPRPIWVGQDTVLYHRSHDLMGRDVATLLYDVETQEGSLLRDGLVMCSPYNPLEEAALCCTPEKDYFWLGASGERVFGHGDRACMDFNACWSPDKRWLAYSRVHPQALVEGPHAVYVLNPTTGKEIQVALWTVVSCLRLDEPD